MEKIPQSQKPLTNVLTNNKKKKKWDKEDLNNTISKLKLNAVQRTLNPESKMHILLLGNI